VNPQLVVQVEYLEWTEQGHLRMPIFITALPSAESRECVAAPPLEALRLLDEAGDEGAAPAPEPAQPDAVPPSASLYVLGSTDPDPAARARLVLGQTRAALTNLDKVFWPEERYTKGDLISYYAAIAPSLMPYLKDRPVMLVRYPDGIDGKNFYQWNTPKGTPDWISTLELRSEERDGKEVTTFLVDHIDVLLHIANLGCIPVHVLASRKSSLDYCDWLTIDFDLGEQPLKEAIKMALALRELLEELGLSGFPKTSGQSGLHVFIPMGPSVAFPFAKGLLELLGRVLQNKFPEISTMERRVRERGGRIYIDTGQTGRSRTIVAPYSVRAHPGGRVSTPLLWDEMHLALKPEAHTMFTVPERVMKLGDPMSALVDARPDLPAALTKLERWIRP
jgi:bifunctional non-homologous end joining protein LigD